MLELYEHFVCPEVYLGKKTFSWGDEQLIPCFSFVFFRLFFFFLYVSFPTQFLLDIVGKGPMLHFQNYIKKKKSIWKVYGKSESLWLEYFSFAMC